MKQVKLNSNVNRLLTEVAAKRKEEGLLNSTKQAVVAELIMAQHKKECR